MKKPPLTVRTLPTNARMMPAAGLLTPKRKPVVESHAYNWRSRAGLKRGTK